MKLVILLIAVLLLVWLVLGSLRRFSQRKGAGAPPTRTSAAPQVEGMVACAHCGVHLPASLALSGGKQVYCNASHRDAGPRA